MAEHLSTPAVPRKFDIEEKTRTSSSSLIQSTNPHSTALVSQLVSNDGVKGHMVAVHLDGLNTGLSALQTPEHQFAFLGEKNEAIQDDDINEPFSGSSTLVQERSLTKISGALSQLYALARTPNSAAMMSSPDLSLIFSRRSPLASLTKISGALS